MTTMIMAAALVKFVTIDPGHFHASLVQNRTYPEVSPEVAVFAPDGIELENHLKLVDAFNTRKDSPTAWREDVYRGDDYLAKFSAAAKDGKLGEKPVVILAGKNNRKGDYALAAVKTGCNVLSDKPMAINPEVFEKTEKAARLAQEKGLYFADIMTERCEITTILQHELAKFSFLYGEQEKGTPEDPAIVKESVHHFCKLVNGAPLKRPEWYYDTKVQGEGIVDVTTHLVDIVQWKVRRRGAVRQDVADDDLPRAVQDVNGWRDRQTSRVRGQRRVHVEAEGRELQGVGDLELHGAQGDG